MSLEQRVECLESQFDSLDGAVRSLMHIVGETHQVMLENQRENRIRFDQQERKIEVIDRKVEVIDRKVEVIDRKVEVIDRKVEGLETEVKAVRSDLSGLTAATFAGFKRSDEQHNETIVQIKQLESLIRQNHSDS